MLAFFITLIYSLLIVKENIRHDKVIRVEKLQRTICGINSFFSFSLSELANKYIIAFMRTDE